MRYFFVFLFIICVVAGFFWLGFLIGNKFVVKESETAVMANTILINSTSTATSSVKKESFCTEETKFFEEQDKVFCEQKPKITELHGIQIDLEKNKALLYDEGKLKEILPLFYQSQEGKWFQAPTGYFRLGVKRESHLSSLFAVIMPYSIQLYEDFFLHGIPYYLDGTQVNTTFTGGCLRFKDEVAKEIYNFSKTGDQVLVYKTIDNLILKSEFNQPVELSDYWIRQGFNNPIRFFWEHGGTNMLKFDYYQHTGLDLAPNLNSDKLSVYAIYDAIVAEIQLNDGFDHGFGNTIILEHQIDGKKIYFLYGHLGKIKESLKKGDLVAKGEIIGEIGNSGFGCDNYWRVGEDGCNSNFPADKHLHLEIKEKPILSNPKGGDVCFNKNIQLKPCYGYTPDIPLKYGYLNPTEFLFDKNVSTQP